MSAAGAPFRRMVPSVKALLGLQALDQLAEGILQSLNSQPLNEVIFVILVTFC